MERAYIGLGSNLESPLEQVNAAVRALSVLQQTTLIAVSPCYQSKAIGPGTQPDYINAVAELATTMPPLELLAALQAIENQQGRVRLQRWGARTLDLDLLLYGDHCIEMPGLSVPHPRMLERNFVLRPLLDIAPELCLPGGVKLADVTARLGSEGLRLVTGGSSPAMGDASGATTRTTTGDHP